MIRPCVDERWLCLPATAQDAGATFLKRAAERQFQEVGYHARYRLKQLAFRYRPVHDRNREHEPLRIGMLRFVKE